MAEKKVVAVCGATGKQGGSVVDALLARGSHLFTVVHGVARDAGLAKCKALAERGVQVVAADYDNAASLHKAFEGAYGAFLVTNYWDHMDAKREARQAAALVEACAAAGVEHAVWSTLEDTRAFNKPGERMPALGPHGEYCVPHFDEKGAADKLFVERGVPTTFLRTSFFFENFLPGKFGMEPKRADPACGGPLVLALPMATARLSGIAVRRETAGVEPEGVCKKVIQLFDKNGSSNRIFFDYLAKLNAKWKLGLADSSFA